MKIQVLVATMGQSNYSLLDKMNIQTSAIVGNQCNKNEIFDFVYKGNTIKWLSFAEKGVGLNRNNALMRASADIIMFADDDMIFVPNYESVVKEAYRKLPDADVIIFDLQYPKEARRPITKAEKLSPRKCMRFGAARISAKLNSIKINGISFNLCFGGGTQFSSGEDSLFLMDCIRKGLKIYSYPIVIACLEDRKSTWFNGYNEKFFFDKGVVFSLMFPKLCKMYALIHVVKHRKRYEEYGWLNAYKKMKQGIKYRNERV